MKKFTHAILLMVTEHYFGTVALNIKDIPKTEGRDFESQNVVQSIFILKILRLEPMSFSFGHI